MGKLASGESRRPCSRHRAAGMKSAAWRAPCRYSRITGWKKSNWRKTSKSPQAEAETERLAAARSAGAGRRPPAIGGRFPATGLASLADGDLLFRLNQSFAAEYEKLRNDFNSAMDRLADNHDGDRHQHPGRALRRRARSPRHRMIFPAAPNSRPPAWNRPPPRSTRSPPRSAKPRPAPARRAMSPTTPAADAESSSKVVTRNRRRHERHRKLLGQNRHHHRRHRRNRVPDQSAGAQCRASRPPAPAMPGAASRWSRPRCGHWRSARPRPPRKSKP